VDWLMPSRSASSPTGTDPVAATAWTPRRDLDHLDACIGQDRVKRCRELSGAIADEEPDPGGAVTEVHDEVAGLLGGPGFVGMPAHAQHVQVVGFQNAAHGADQR
jgi:hypothetical protein